MIVPKQFLDEFYSYIQTQLGLELIIHDPPQDDELARTVWGDRLIVVRPLAPRSSGGQVEVWCSDAGKLSSLEDAWAHHWVYLVSQQEGNDEDDDLHESSNE